MERKEEDLDLPGLASKIAGSLLGLAIGDALGAPVEGKGADEVQAILGKGRTTCTSQRDIDCWDADRLFQHPNQPVVTNAPIKINKSAINEEDGEEERQDSEEEDSDEDEEDSEGESWVYVDSSYGIKGMYTDDTQYALCSLQSIFEVSLFAHSLSLSSTNPLALQQID